MKYNNMDENKDKISLLASALKFSQKYDKKCFIYIYDKEKQRALHFSSHSNFDQNDIFN